MMRKNYAFFALALLAYSAGAKQAEEVLKIGYVNLSEALSQEHEAQKYTKEIEKKEQDILDAEQKASLDIEKKLSDFQKSIGKLSEKAKLEQQTSLSNEYNNLRQLFTQRRIDLNKERQEILASLENKNRLLIESIARREGYTLMLNEEAILHASSEMKKHNKTAALVAECNKVYPVKAEEPKKAVPSVKKPQPQPQPQLQKSPKVKPTKDE